MPRPTALLRLFRTAITLMGTALLALPTSVGAQAVYGIGQAGTGTITIAGSNQLFTINMTTGAATQICTLSSPSTAASVSSIDGQVYYIDRDGSGTPKLYRINPLTCANTLIGNISERRGRNRAGGMSRCAPLTVLTAASMRPPTRRNFSRSTPTPAPP